MIVKSHKYLQFLHWGNLNTNFERDPKMSSSAAMNEACFYYNKLQKNKDMLVSHFQRLDLINLSREFCKYKIIGKEVRSTLASLDHDHLDSTIQIHYLLQFIMKGVKDERTYQLFSKILNAMSKESGICIFLDEDECSPNCHILIENDIKNIMTILAPCAYMWEELGIALGLDKVVLEQCRAGTNLTVKLYNVLYEWIVKQHKQAFPPTIQNLEENLRGPLVNYSNIASQIAEYRSRYLENSPHSSVKTTRTSLKIGQEPIDTEVSDGKSTLLEVLVFPTEFSTYQWMKDGEKIHSESFSYSGVNSPILVINIAGVTTEGNYSCRISRKNETITSEDAVLTVSYCSEKKLLRELYLAKKDMPCDSWPPDVTKHFINLALISKDTINSSDNDYSIRGNADDIIERKENIGYEAAFGSFKKRSLMLIEGRPGIGKTTLVHKISRDWAEGKALHKTKLVLYVSLRVIGTDSRIKDARLSDILKYYFHFTDEDVQHILHDIDKCLGDGICFIIDGLDEFQCKLQSDLHEIMYKKYLPDAMVIVASRPIATTRLKLDAKINNRIEILGFKKAEILQYIDAFPFDDHPDSHPSTKLKAYLQRHLNIFHMCYLPVHSAMICYLYKHAKESSLITETQVYKKFTEFMIARKDLRNQSQGSNCSFTNLKEQDKEYLRNICELAFQMTIHSKQTTSQANIPAALSSTTVETDESSLGLITIDQTASLMGYENIYAFLHLTFQEYLAAFYLYSSSPSDQNKAIESYGHATHMRMAWKFYCGLLNFDNSIDQFKKIIISTTSDDHSTRNQLFKVQCAFETQQQLPCNFLLENVIVNGVLNLNETTLTTSDLTAICYVISFSSHIELEMKNCNLDYEKLQNLITGLNEISTIIQRLNLSLNDFGSKGIQLLSEKLRPIIYNNLQKLSLAFSNINSESAVALIECLKYNKELQELDLSVNHIGTPGAKAIAKCLKGCSNLQVLDIADNGIDTKGAQYIGEALRHWSIRTLNLSVNKIKSDGAKTISKQLPHSKLESLDISSDGIDSTAVEALIESWKCCKKLQNLNVSDNPINSKDISDLKKALPNVTIYSD